MALLFIIIGALLLTSAIRGKEATDELTSLFKSDFTGPSNYLVWALAIGSVAALGYVKSLKTLSEVFLILIFIRLILGRSDNTGNSFFTEFFNQIRSTERV